MPDADGRPERVNAFVVGDLYLFSHYFDGEDVFAELRPYYNADGYRFEVPRGEFDDLRSSLAEYGYEFRVVTDLAPFVVAVEQYSAHPEGIFGDSVLHRSGDGYNWFLLTDQLSVAGAVAEGAERAGDVDPDHPFR